MQSHLRFVAYIFLSLTVLMLAYFATSSPIKQSTVQASDVEPTPPPDMSGAASVLDLAPSEDRADLRMIPTGGPGSYSQSVFAFQPYPNQAVPYLFSGRTLVNPDTITHYYEAPVNLPHGATITRFVVWYMDNNTSNLWAALARASLDEATLNQIGYVASSGADAYVRYSQDLTITDPVVDNENYFYWVEVGLPPNATVGILSFRIDYQYSNYVPLTTK